MINKIKKICFIAEGYVGGPTRGILDPLEIESFGFKFWRIGLGTDSCKEYNTNLS